MRLAALALPATLAAVALAGCAGQSSNQSSDDFQGDQKAIATVIDDLGDAGSSKDANEICNTIFDRAVVTRLKQGSRDCEDIVKDQLDDASSFDLTVKKVAVSGTTATATVDSDFDGDTVPRTVRLRKDGNAWRITAIDS